HADHVERCPNCSQPLPDKEVVFCPHCGQQNQSSKVSMRDFLRRFFQHFTHLDNKFVRTVHDLFIPGKMTEVYFRGKRKRYPHPVQLFFIAMFFFLLTATPAVVNLTSITIRDKDKKGEERFRGDTFYELLQRQANSLQLYHLMDSLPADMRTAEHRRVVDSLLSRSHDAPLREFQRLILLGKEAERKGSQAISDTALHATTAISWTEADSIGMGVGVATYTFEVRDMVFFSDEELMRRYGIQGRVDRVLVRQSLKMLHDPSALMKFYTGSFSWTMLVLAAVMALFMLLLYRRQKRYYIEHFVFLLHGQSALLLVVALLFGLHRLLSLPSPKLWASGVMAWASISLLWGLKRYYGGSWLGTTWRWLLFILCYLLAFSVFFALGLLLA
ncbi:MAG TPA: DUF3667 domain-containing protein, partial [Saprospiraceae bacterium]|nr:DUF3667 domain-containing protein [Saprospiraceae bacterium]